MKRSLYMVLFVVMVLTGPKLFEDMSKPFLERFVSRCRSLTLTNLKFVWKELEKP